MVQQSLEQNNLCANSSHCLISFPGQRLEEEELLCNCCPGSKAGNEEQLHRVVDLCEARSK